jgi:hypothetical protein
MQLRLRKENLFTLLLRRRHNHHSMKVATLEVAKKLYLTPHELVHWHESGLLGSTELANQLVAYVWKFGNNLKEIFDTLVEVCLCRICILHDDAGPLGQAYALKALTHETE